MQRLHTVNELSFSISPPFERRLWYCTGKSGVVHASYQLEVKVSTFVRQKQCRKHNSSQSLVILFYLLILGRKVFE